MISAAPSLSCSSPIETFFVGYFFFFLAKSSIEFVGSAPADSKKSGGTFTALSFHSSSTESVTGWTYCVPSTSEMNFVEASRALSSLTHRIRHNCRKWLIGSEAILSAKSGIGEFSGSFTSIQACHAYSFRLIRSGRSLKVTLLFFENRWAERALRFAQAFASIHENWFPLSSPPSVYVFKKNWISCGMSLPSSIRILSAP